MQAAYQIDRFRRTYWRDRLGYEWRLPSWFSPNSTKTPVGLRVYETYNASLIKTGGADAEYTFIRCMTNKCEESDIIFHEFGHNIIFDRFAFVGNGPRRIGRGQSDREEGPAMDEAFADYFAASFTNDPQIDRCRFCIVNVDRPCLCLGAKRDLSRRKRYPRDGSYRYEAHDGSLILSGALWDLRNLLDGENAAEAPITDRLVFDAFARMIETMGGDAEFSFADFVTAVKAEDVAGGGIHANEIDEAFDRHNLGPHVIDYAPLAWADDVGLTEVDDSNPSQVALRWQSLPGALSYEVLMVPVSHSYDEIGLSSFSVIATGLTDTFFVYTTRDSLTEYLFSVVGVDTSGQAGYMAAAAFVPAPSPVSVPLPSGSPVPAQGQWLYNSPNPSSSGTKIVFELVAADDLYLEVLDVAGRSIRTFGKESYAPGRHAVSWDGRNAAGHRVAAGIYFVRLTASQWKDRGKVLIVQ